MTLNILVTVILLCGVFCIAYGLHEVADGNVPSIHTETCNCSCDFGTDPVKPGVAEPIPTYKTSTVDVGPSTGKECACSCDIETVHHTPEGKVAMVSQACNCKCNYTIKPENMWECDCDYHPGGCRIVTRAPPYYGCKCSYKGGWTCGGEVVLCKNFSSPQCLRPTTDIHSCLHGGGDCNGYHDAQCDCDYHPGGCRISTVAPAYAACKCIYKGGWTCGGEIVPCSDENSPLCANPTTSVQSCVLGGGDCSGYGDARCDCDYHPGGCAISKEPPANTACKCSYVGAWTCRGDVVRCRNESSPHCKSPSKTHLACNQGGGDCDGYQQANCDCDYHPGGCRISKVAPRLTACKCKYMGAWTCSGEIVLCRDEKSQYCQNPDASNHSCTEGGGDCDGYREASCDCDYHPGGCRIVTSAPPNYGCKCSYKGGWTCGGEVVLCKNNSSPQCLRPTTDIHSCLHGGGDCNGYHDAQCDCDYHPGGCRISTVAPAYAACKCIYKGGWTCGGEIVPCSDENSPLCANPTTSVQSCVLGGGDCSGYGDARCDCDYHPGGCAISKEPPTNTACKCSYVGAWTCRGDVVRCREESSPHCKSPSKTHLACIQGGGDCDGYQQANCDCDYHPGGCRISKVAPRLTACKCKYMGAWTCSGELVLCRDEKSQYCQNPDASIHSCTEGGGDCDGYKEATCDCDYHPGGCSISKAAPPNTACRCSYKGAWTCGGSVKPCRDFENPKCKNPDKSIQACFQGNGDCEGYHSAQCDCCYHPGGCKVCRAPQPHTACHCSYKGFWTCSGRVRRCANENAYRCQHPDGSRDTCLQGGGDCGGY